MNTSQERFTHEQLISMSAAVRVLSMDMVEKAKSGHPGLPLGAADLATALYTHGLKYHAADPDWPDRDRFVLSAGHGSALLYSLLHLAGYKDFTIDQLKMFRQISAYTAGHPEYGHGAGIETTTGPLGQGLANAVGMAIAEKHLNALFGGELVNHRVYTLVGDGCLSEGVSQEAINLAGHLKLGKLIVIWDNNSITIDGGTSLSTSENQHQRFQAAGWQTLSCDGHNFESINQAFETINTIKGTPIFLDCKTIIGYPAPKKQGTAGAHGAPLGTEEIAATRKALQWTNEPFDIPEQINALWKKAGARRKKTYDDWNQTLAKHPKREEFLRRIKGTLNASFAETVKTFIADVIEKKPKVATRKASQNVIAALFPHVPEMVGGSADLTNSNLTKCPEQQAFNADSPAGTYLHYGIREHGMAAAMNGIALHGGVIPYGGTFLVFTDYCRPSIRLAALMKQRVIYIMTHDSIGLGEDGPTHQPIEHLASLRQIPNLLVLRPCDSAETAECWQMALERTNGPTLLALSRQNLPTMRQNKTSENLSRKGAYVVRDDGNNIVLMASGSEVSICSEVAEKLAEKHIRCRLVSVPCLEAFESQDDAYRQNITGSDVPVFTVEAASTMPWQAMRHRPTYCFGMHSFGASGNTDSVYRHFGLDADSIAKKIMTLL